MSLFSNLKKILIYPIAALALIIQHLISPLLLIRVSVFDSSRIGNLYYLYWVDCQEKKKFPFVIDLFFSSKAVANQYWQFLFAKKFIIFPYNIFLAKILDLNRRFFKTKKYQYPMFFHRDAYAFKQAGENIYLKKQPYFSLTKDEIDQGVRVLKEMKLDIPFICFHNRDTAYLDKVSAGNDWTYHDYRDSSISNYLKAAEYLTTQGYYAIRVGSVAKEKITTSNPKIFDYPGSSFRSDFMDVFLGSQSKIFLCSDCGVSIIPELFDVPIVFVNVVPIARFWIKQGMYVPKRFFSNTLNRELTFKEILANPDLSLNPESKHFKDNNITLIENTADEIYLAVKEMNERLNGTWVNTPEMDELQRRYWLLAPDIRYRSEKFFISASYLMANKYLLD